nr:PREDICTED: uncharacterized protein LOC104314317 isoform X2 [Haliaeetus albicilla]
MEGLGNVQCNREDSEGCHLELCVQVDVRARREEQEGQRDAARPTARESPVLASPRSCPCHGGRKSPSVLLSVLPPDLQRYQPAAEGAVASGVLIALTSHLLPDSIRYRRGSCDALRISALTAVDKTGGIRNTTARLTLAGGSLLHIPEAKKDLKPLSNQRLLFDGHLLQKLSLPVQPPAGEQYLNAKAFMTESS